ncbi:unnamed protein product [Rotaria sordida]|uniref:ubiquitinyl hydrolase 1 n=1 Tax=Rotaria sordida TaxID=392033 RepID=A0A814I9H0_9BILA|nr:unnamed protein product [Rotaria sordida]
MTNNISRCPHVATIGFISTEDYLNAIQHEKCVKCDCIGPHLWLCLREGCLFVGCGSGKEKNDHSTEHEKEKAHPLQLNLTTKRIWCYVCNQEVYSNNDPSFELSFIDRSRLQSKSSKLINNVNQSINNSVQVNVVNLVQENSLNQSIIRRNQYEKCFEPTLFELEHSDTTDFTRGISGLYNLGNTCYMNSALQALSNCVPLTSYFLDCIPFIGTNSYRRINGDLSHIKPNGRLVTSYLKFIESMWIKPLRGRESHVINPSSIAAEIRSINPSFRSYTQQDAQEFLRCFMDELHSEMRSVQFDSDDKHRSESSSTENSDVAIIIPNLNSESEYETCYSGFTSSSDDNSNDDEKKKYASINEINEYSKKKIYREKSQSLSRTDSGVSLNRNKKQEEQKINLFDKNMKTINSYSNKSKRILTNSIISSIFDGTIQSQIECLTCNRRSSTIETFQDLSLPIPSREQLEKFHSIQYGNDDQLLSTNQQIFDQNKNDSWISWFYSLFKNLLTLNIWGPPLTLQDCLQAFFQADELTGDNMYSCEKCRKLRNGIKYCKVVELPEVLCIHLKRFRHDSMIYTKIGSYVSFPLVDLDMTPFIHKDCRSKIHMYDLFACIVHYGRAGSGHYITYALNGLNQQWYEYDDENVRQVDPAIVQNAEAYVLFYRKKEPNISETYEAIRHLLARDQDYLLPFYISRSWINRFFYFAEPGPITNNDFLCKHGGVLPHYWSVINDLVCPVPESVWQYLSEKHGGCSVCNILYPCRKCQLDDENLKCRQRLEKKTFLQLKRSEKDTDAIYALSPNWYRDWENFVCEKSSEPPGQISNASISITKNGITRLLRRDCNYFQVNESIWNFLYSIYGGGPELIIRPNSTMNSNSNVDDQISSNNKPAVTFV